jgi:hypothetical protein
MPLGGLLPYPPGEQEEFDPARITEAVAGVQDHVRSQALASQPQEPPFQAVTQRADGTTDLKGVTPAALQYFQQMVQRGQEATALYDRIIQQADRKREVLEQNPILSAVGRIASQAATNYQGRGPGRPLVNAAGAFGSEFFADTPESLLVRAAQAGQAKFGIQGQVLNQAEDQRRFEIQQERIDAQIAASQAENKIALAKEARLTKAGFERQVLTEARQRILPDAESIVKDAEAHGYSPEEAVTLAKRAAETQENSKREQELIQSIADKKARAEKTFEWAKMNAEWDRRFSLEGLREMGRRQREEDEKVARELKAGEIKEATKKTIVDYDSTLAQLNRLEKLIQENPQYQTSITNPRGLVPTRVLGLAGRKDEVRFRTDLRNSIQTIVKTHGAGARGYNPTEFKMVIEPLSAMPIRTQAENLAAIGAAKAILLEKIHSLANVMEATDKDISQFELFKRAGIVISPPTKAAGVPEGTIIENDKGERQVRRGGKWVPLK